MKKHYLKTITAAFLAVCMICVLVFTAACNKDKSGDSSSVTSAGQSVNSVIPDNSRNSANTGNSGNSGGKTSDNSGNNSGNSGSGNAQPGQDVPAAEDRSAFTAESLTATTMSMTLYDFIAMFCGEGVSILDGVLFGDVVNGAIASADAEIAVAKLTSLGYTRYDDGIWRSNLTGEKVNEIVNAFLNFRIDGSEELDISDEQLETYGTSSILDLLGYKNNPIITGYVNEYPVAKALLNAQLYDIVALMNGDVTAAITIFGELSVGEIAATFGLEADEMIAEMTVNGFIGLVNAQIAMIEEMGFEAYAQQVAMTIVSLYLMQNGENEIIPGVTYNDIYAAANGDEEAVEKLELVAEAYVDTFFKAEFGADFKTVCAGVYKEVKDLVVYGDKTIGDIVNVLYSKTVEEVAEMVKAEIEKIETDEEYAKQLLETEQALAAAYVDAFLSAYGEYEVFEGVSLNDIIAALMSEEAYEEGGEGGIAVEPAPEEGGEKEAITKEELVSYLISVVDPYVVGTLGMPLEMLYETYYPVVKDLPIYGEYTIGNIVEAFEEAEDPEVVFAFLMAEFGRLTEDEEYAQAMLAPIVAYAYAFASNATVGALVYMTGGQFVYLDYNDSYNALIDTIGNMTILEAVSGGIAEAVVDYSKNVTVAEFIGTVFQIYAMNGVQDIETEA